MPPAPLNRLDSTIALEGDTDWRGFRSRPAATALPPGIDRYAENMRYERAYKQPRAGCKALATDLDLVNPPVVLDFDLPTAKAVTSMTRSGSTVTVTTTAAHGWSTGNIAAIEGAVQTDYNDDWEITVTGAATFTFDIGSATPASPATGTITASKGLRVFGVYDERVRVACVYADDDNTEHVLAAAGESAWVLTQGESSVEIAYPSGEDLLSATEVDLQVYLGYVYLFRGRAAGAVFTISSITRSSSTVTVTTSASHGRATGDWVRLTGQTAEEYRGVWQVTVTGAATFTYDIGAATPASPASVAGQCYHVEPVLKWDRNTANDFAVVTTGGMPETLHIRMPPADWGLPFNDQMWVPLARDEMIASDFNSDSVFDTANAQLRFRPGGNDWLIAAYPGPMTDEPGAIGPRLLVLMRKSLFLVYLNSDNLTIEAKKQIPGAEGVGCRARRTLQTCGDFIAWLSDSGVQLARLGRELSLLTAARPLSVDVHDIIERINWDVAGNACASFFNNRYYLAVPLDDSTTNNTILVFNFLNIGADAPFGEWESVDVYPGDFDVIALLVLDYDGRQRLHAVSSTGYAYVLEVQEQDEHGAPGSDLGSYDVTGIAQGRRLLFGNLENKRFHTVRVDIETEGAAEATVAFSTANPDSTRTLATYEATAAEDRTISRRPRMRGTSGALDLTLSSGRPIVKSVSIEATGGSSNTRDRA